jgi:hypothetical protein
MNNKDSGNFPNAVGVVHTCFITILLTAMLFIPSACANQITVPSTPSPTPKIATSTDAEVIDPLTIGKDWNDMTLSQKRIWVDTTLRAMVIGGELKESERQPTDYYVQKLDMIFYNPDNEKKLVAWELTAFTSIEKPVSYPDWWSKEQFSNINPMSLPIDGTVEMLPNTTSQIPFSLINNQVIWVRLETTSITYDAINYIEPVAKEYSSVGLLMNGGMNPEIHYTGDDLYFSVVKVTSDGKGLYDTNWYNGTKISGFGGFNNPVYNVQIYLSMHEGGIYSLLITNKTGSSHRVKYYVSSKPN